MLVDKIGEVYCMDIGREDHGRPSYRLYVDKALLPETEELEFPIAGAKIERVENVLVLRPAQGWYTYDVFVRSGYRGRSDFTLLSPGEQFPYRQYRSQRGSLGISGGALVCSKEDSVTYKWERTGRLYDEFDVGITILYSDGRREEYAGMPDLQSLMALRGHASGGGGENAVETPAESNIRDKMLAAEQALRDLGDPSLQAGWLLYLLEAIDPGPGREEVTGYDNVLRSVQYAIATRLKDLRW